VDPHIRMMLVWWMGSLLMMIAAFGWLMASYPTKQFEEVVKVFASLPFYLTVALGSIEIICASMLVTLFKAGRFPFYLRMVALALAYCSLFFGLVISSLSIHLTLVAMICSITAIITDLSVECLSQW